MKRKPKPVETVDRKIFMYETSAVFRDMWVKGDTPVSYLRVQYLLIDLPELLAICSNDILSGKVMLASYMTYPQ